MYYFYITIMNASGGSLGNFQFPQRGGNPNIATSAVDEDEEDLYS
jgi:hypothetical protein